MSTSQPEGADQKGLRLPGWRSLLVLWGLVAVVAAGAVFWAEWRVQPSEQVAAALAPSIAGAEAPAREWTVASEAPAASGDPTPSSPASAEDLPIPAGEPPPPPVLAMVPEAPAPAAHVASPQPAPAQPAALPGPERAAPVPQAIASIAPATGPEPVEPGEATRPAAPSAGEEPSPAPQAPVAPPLPLAISAPAAPATDPPSPAITPSPPLAVEPVAQVPATADPAPASSAVIPAAPDPVPAPALSPSLAPGALASVLPPAVPAPPPGTGARQLAVARPPPLPSATIAAPDLALLEPSRHGFLPRRGADGRLPYQVYAQPFRRADNRPRVAIIVSDNGLSASQSEDAIRRLPPQVAIAISPYAPQPEALAARVRERGMETLVALPLEPAGYPLNDPGARPLLIASSAAQNADNLDWVLSRFAGYVGAIGALGSMRGERFAQMPDPMRRLHDTLRDRGLLYVDPRPGTPTSERVWGRTVDMVIDDPPTRIEIERRLNELDIIARLRGSAVGYAGTLTLALVERIVSWSAGLEARGLVFAPLSAVLRVRQPLEPTPAADPAVANR